MMERPQPVVPDVSLILDSASTSMHSITSRMESPNVNYHSKVSTTGNNSGKEISPNMMNFANYYPTPPQPSNHSSNLEQLQPSIGGNHTDSGRGTSGLSVSSEKDDTVADESLSSETRNSSLDISRDAEILKSSIATILKIVVDQNSTISKLDAQMQQIISFQERFLSHMLAKSSRISKETQTESRSSVDVEKAGFQRPKSSDNLSRGTPSPKSSERKPPSSEVVVRSHNTTPTPNSTLKTTPKTGRESRIPVSSLGGDKEDLSAFLKNIHVGNGHDPSLYSIKSIEVPDYHNDTFQNDSFNGSPNIGPSVSAYGSSSEDESETTEPVKPTKTFYNNLLGTVNRILEGGNTNTRPASTSSAVKSTTRIAKTSSQKGAVPSPSSCGSTGSYSSDLSCTGSERFAFRGGNNCEEKENIQKQTNFNAPPVFNEMKESNNVVDVTKKYLQTLGVQFESPVPPNDQSRPPLRGATSQQQQNYMIQQNVYNSIYIPTLNCAPMVSDSINSNSGMMDNLAQKYISPGELNQYEMLQGKKGGPSGTETTVYGMSSNNLSFDTKQYLQRYGLVNQPTTVEAPPENLYGQQPLRPQVQNVQQMAHKSNRILDITAIRNQPKLL
ncbi:SCL-interrupting locus protein [Orchesella cincta]|uniref:SCL-interrupting locus protein n=1 Tax=Orchesella cincta TaxID=48709 RepID=A0A1D2MUZ9_ORCCI|nr:SCL-interrupting locus protein [Orchesella cincta]